VIQILGRNLDIHDGFDSIIPYSLKEAAPATGMTGNAFLVDNQQQGVAVAIDTGVNEALNLSGGLTLAP
tara:strand:+ start:1270 stop:1476 length:207 start_codon:yes stop_codon:yes gene_type:complete